MGAGLARLLVLIAALVTAHPAAAQNRAAPVKVDLELVLAVDVSGSMDAEEHAVQRSGYVEALRHPDLWAVIWSGVHQRIALTYMEWAGPHSQVIVLPWRVIDSPEAARGFAEDLAARPIAYIRGTSISGALHYAARLFHSNGFEGSGRVIDVSGDGPNSAGSPVEPARDAVLAQGITINGLPIMLRPTRGAVELDRYYHDCVIGGFGAFVMPVTHPAELAKSIRRKLVLEIAVGAAPAVVRAQARARADCTTYRLRRIWEVP